MMRGAVNFFLLLSFSSLFSSFASATTYYDCLVYEQFASNPFSLIQHFQIPLDKPLQYGAWSMNTAIEIKIDIWTPNPPVGNEKLYVEIYTPNHSVDEEGNPVLDDNGDPIYKIPKHYVYPKDDNQFGAMVQWEGYFYKIKCRRLADDDPLVPYQS